MVRRRFQKFLTVNEHEWERSWIEAIASSSLVSTYIGQISLMAWRSSGVGVGASNESMI